MNDEIKKADEIVRALRDYASDCDNCCDCFRCDFACVCGKFDYNAPKIIADLIESLTEQLTESQRREKAAVEAVGKFARNAHTCISGDSPECHVKDDHGWCAKCHAWKWCGPQAEKGEADGN